MYISCGKNNGIQYLRLMEDVTKFDKQGKPYKSKKSVLSIGPLSRYDDGLPNYVERLRASFDLGTPLIDKLIPFVQPKEKEVESSDEMIQFSKYGDYELEGVLFASALFDKLFEELGLTQWLTLYKSRSRISYDILGLTKLLVYGRVLDPASKRSTFKQNVDYFEPVVKEAQEHHVYDVLDELYDVRTNIIRKIDDSVSKKIGRDKELLFYDVTNFYFETCQADDNYIDEDGVEQKGLRQRGVSKENRKEPIVQVGLFLDQSGIPVSFEVFPGNTLDQATLRPALKKTIDTLNNPRFILVSDRGMSSCKNAIHLLKSGNGFLISKSIKKSRKIERNWAIEQSGYIHVSNDFKYKSRIVKRMEKDEDGNIFEYDELVVVYWSRKFYERERQEHHSFLTFMEKLEKNPETFRITKTDFGKVKKYLKKEVLNDKTGEIIDSNDLKSLLDKEKLEEFTAYMGYYQIVTSELKLDPLDIIDKYHGLSRIEDQFRVMKSTLETRPLYVTTREHIIAHILICFIALVLLRIIQHKIRLKEGKDVSKCTDWDVGLSANRIQDALYNWRVAILPDAHNVFVRNKSTNDDLKIILDAFDIKIRGGAFTHKELKEIKSQIRI